MTKKEELIASLNEAFKIEKTKKDRIRYRMESLSVDDHVCNRMLDIEEVNPLEVDLQSEKQYIEGFIHLLRNEPDRVINKSGDELDAKYQAACDKNDKDEILRLYRFVKENLAKIHMLDRNDAKRIVLMMHITNEISRL